jgi:hypothetical protein
MIPDATKICVLTFIYNILEATRYFVLEQRKHIEKA